MHISNPTIEFLLNQNGAKRFGTPGCSTASKQRLELSKFIAKNYASFDILRIHLFNQHDQKLSTLEYQEIQLVASRLISTGWIKARNDNSYKVSENLTNEIIRYLRGQWLEEYIYEAFIEVGVDEAYHGQRITWGSDESPSFFEIDVIARKSSQLYLVSCKAIKTEPEQGRSTMLRQFMSEALSWNELLTAKKANMIIVTTADMIDESRLMKQRYEPLIEQSKALNQTLLGVEHLSWDALIKNYQALLC